MDDARFQVQAADEALQAGLAEHQGVHHGNNPASLQLTAAQSVAAVHGDSQWLVHAQQGKHAVGSPRKAPAAAMHSAYAQAEALQDSLVRSHAV